MCVCVCACVCARALLSARLCVCMCVCVCVCVRGPGTESLPCLLLIAVSCDGEPARGQVPCARCASASVAVESDRGAHGVERSVPWTEEDFPFFCFLLFCLSFVFFGKGFFHLVWRVFVFKRAPSYSFSLLDGVGQVSPGRGVERTRGEQDTRRLRRNDPVTLRTSFFSFCVRFWTRSFSFFLSGMDHSAYTEARRW